MACCRWYGRYFRAVPTYDSRAIDDTLVAVGNPRLSRFCFTIYEYVLHRYIHTKIILIIVINLLLMWKHDIEQPHLNIIYIIFSIYHNQSINNLIARSFIDYHFFTLSLLIKYVFALSYIMIRYASFLSLSL